MNLLLDQMLDEDVATALQAEGHNVLRVSAFDMKEAEDDEILNKAIETSRILVTLDEHFGDWAILPISHHPGVIRVKADPTSTNVVLAIVLPFLKQHATASLVDHLVIVKPRHVRWIKTA